MPAFRFTSDGVRVYPNRPLTAHPGDVTEWDEVPDGWWEPTDEPVTRNSDNLPQPDTAEAEPGSTGETLSVDLSK